MTDDHHLTKSKFGAMTLVGHLNPIIISNFNNPSRRTATILHLKTVKLQYLRNGLIGRWEIWYDNDIGPMNFTLPPQTLCLLFYVIKPQKNTFKKYFICKF